jgi:hypothetical protein
VTRFSLQQCKTIQIPVVCATLNKMAINHNVTHAIVFGPKKLGGMALFQIHTLQDIHIIQYSIGHITTNYGVGKLMRICIESTQLEVGTFEPFMFTLHSIYGPATLTASWVLEIWSFLKLFKATITLTKIWLPLPQRQNDQSIMSLATLYTYREGELRKINRCRIYLRVLSVSDITYFDGTRVLQTCYDGLLSVDNTTIRWSNQQRPQKVVGQSGDNSYSPSAMITVIYFNLLETGLTFQTGTTTANGLLLVLISPSSTKLATNSSLNPLRVEETHNSCYTQSFYFTPRIFTPKQYSDATVHPWSAMTP